MASEYSLNLKAVLDTSDVQQKLNQLKQQQQGASSGNGGVGAGGIQQALQRLNTTLTTLQHSIDKLVSGKSTGGHGSGYIPFVAARQALRARPQPAAQWHSRVLTEEQRINADLNPIHSGRAVLDPQRLQYLRNNPTLAALRSPSGQGSLASGSKMSPQMRANLRMGAGLAFGTIAGGVENYAQATGNQGLATGAGFVKNIGYGAAAGAMVGGPIGAAIGGSVGALNAAFEELARRARDTADALEDQAARVRSGRRFDIELKDFEQQRQDNQMLKKQTSGTSEERTEAGNYFRKQLEEAKKKYDNVRANMEKTGVAAEGGVEAYEKQTQKLLELRGKDDEEVKQRQKTADIYKDQFYWLQKHSARIEQLDDIIPKAQKAREFATSRFGLNPEKHPEIKDWTRYGAMGGVRGLAAAEQAKSLREALSNLKAPDMANVNSLASQGFMISAADDEARLDEANKHLTDLVNLTRSIKDKENEAATYS